MTLDQLKRHPLFPFRDFPSNDLSFLLLELYWAELFRDVLAQAGGDAGISNWIPQTPAQRADANPVLHLTDQSAAPFRELRIIQRFNLANLPELDLDHPSPVRFTGDAYVPFVPDLTAGAVAADGETPVEELVISSDISEACERLNRQLIVKWCVSRASVEEMREALNQYWEMVRSNLQEIPVPRP